MCASTCMLTPAPITRAIVPRQQYSLCTARQRPIDICLVILKLNSSSVHVPRHTCYTWTGIMHQPVTRQVCVQRTQHHPAILTSAMKLVLGMYTVPPSHQVPMPKSVAFLIRATTSVAGSGTNRGTYRERHKIRLALLPNHMPSMTKWTIVHSMFDQELNHVAAVHKPP